LGNALQHGSPEGPVELSAASKGSTLVLNVHNEGVPIPPEAMPTLFNPLVRYATVESTLERAQGSIGLGLYIVREIVNATGGMIAVASTAQQGTTFTVRIPRQPPPLERTAAEKSKGSRRVRTR
jgi:signal transduction histidine kinase